MTDHTDAEAPTMLGRIAMDVIASYPETVTRQERFEMLQKIDARLRAAIRRNPEIVGLENPESIPNSHAWWFDAGGGTNIFGATNIESTSSLAEHGVPLYRFTEAEQ